MKHASQDADRIAGYRESAERAVRWLLSIQNPDGTMNPTEKGAFSYYKVPRCLAMAGHHDEAARLLAWAEREIFTADGNFDATRTGFHAAHSCYANCWFVWAAHAMSRFDISYPGMDYVLRFRHPHNGGYCSEGPYRPGQGNEQDLVSTAFASFVGLHLGRLEEAVAAAEFIARFVEQQPEPDKRLWLRTDDNGKLVTAVPEGCEEPRYFVLETEAPGQLYYYLGVSMILLGKLYMLKRQQRYIEAADAFLRTAHRCHPDAFLTDGTGKIGLGAAYLYHATGDPKYAEAARKSCDFLVSDQSDEGPWIRDGKPTASSTAEFAVWLTVVATILGRGETAND